MNQYLAQLDRSLATRGDDVLLRRRIPNSNPTAYVTLTCRARVRGYKPAELFGGIIQGDSNVLMSPTAINQVPASTWPGVAGGDRLPKQGDQITAQGRTRTIQSVETTVMRGEPVRIDAQVRG